uniref:Uncharacterized protein n=1 Tax=Nelumbo nucifera TaxID=4432 RepID=A0A822Y6C8_NELNU|nr:TPA_asm: hypothetical protein HUJ06_029051 [Nelumbo nucifera]
MSTPPMHVIQTSKKSNKLELKSCESKTNSEALPIPRVNKETGDGKHTNEMSKVLIPYSSQTTSNKSDAPYEMSAPPMYVPPLQPTLKPNVLTQPSTLPTPFENVLPQPPLALTSTALNLAQFAPPITPLDIKVTPPQPPPIPPSKESMLMPQSSSMSLIVGVTPPPPPPLNITKSLQLKKANTKLKRSMHMGNLYRLLKGKMEGSYLGGKPSQGRKNQIEGSIGGKQGMADAIAEMTRRYEIISN